MRGPFPPLDDLALARRVLESYAPSDDGQRAVRERVLAFVDAHPTDAHRRTCLEGHLTAATLLLDHACERALLTFHRKLGRWLQIGGHCDGDANLPGVALREASEESGIAGIEIDPTPIDLDLHAIPARPGEPEHLHLDVRFLARAPRGAVARIGPESLDLRWFAPHELAAVDVDASVLRLFRVAFGPA